MTGRIPQTGSVKMRFYEILSKFIVYGFKIIAPVIFNVFVRQSKRCELRYGLKGFDIGVHSFNQLISPWCRQWIESALVQIMACHLFDAKPLS